MVVNSGQVAAGPRLWCSTVVTKLAVVVQHSVYTVRGIRSGDYNYGGTGG
jgi:hypothetical protein